MSRIIRPQGRPVIEITLKLDEKANLVIEGNRFPFSGMPNSGKVPLHPLETASILQKAAAGLVDGFITQLRSTNEVGLTDGEPKNDQNGNNGTPAS